MVESGSQFPPYISRLAEKDAAFIAHITRQSGTLFAALTPTTTHFHPIAWATESLANAVTYVAAFEFLTNPPSVTTSLASFQATYTNHPTTPLDIMTAIPGVYVELITE